MSRPHADTVQALQAALVGQVVAVEAQSPYGDYVLRYADGRTVLIDCGYVGATVYVTLPERQQEVRS